jgi:histidinol-phosphate/aromatic aminotransferase/cobyric acid decarboxylase-like protein
VVRPETPGAGGARSVVEDAEDAEDRSPFRRGQTAPSRAIAASAATDSSSSPAEAKEASAPEADDIVPAPGDTLGENRATGVGLPAAARRRGNGVAKADHRTRPTSPVSSYPSIASAALAAVERTGTGRFQTLYADPFVVPNVSFPLFEWIRSHARLPHTLALSGMVGQLRSYSRCARRAPPASAAAVRQLVAERLGVPPRRVFLTHGATEANGLALQFLSRSLARKRARTPRFRVAVPEYPPLSDGALLAGFRAARGREPTDLWVGSDPNNPRGLSVGRSVWEARASDGAALLIDESFREFADVPSFVRRGAPNSWVTGTLTKFYGADAVRLGWAVAPDSAVESFDRYVSHLTDGIAETSLAAAASLLRHHSVVAQEVRSIFRRNAARLHRVIPEAPSLDAPLWFDIGRSGVDGDRFARYLVRRGLLVCPGRFFGDRSGVRVCLTHRRFPQDVQLYQRFRGDFLDRVRGGTTPTH